MYSTNTSRSYKGIILDPWAYGDTLGLIHLNVSGVLEVHSLKPIPWSTDEVVKSLELLYDGIQCNGKTHRFCLTEIRGDWKFQKDWLDWAYFLGCHFFEIVSRLLGSIANPAGMA